MSVIVVLIFGLVVIAMVRSLFGPSWMLSRWNSHVREMHALSQELQTFAAESKAQSQVSLDAACPACGAPVTSPVETSPRGELKCQHCGRWFRAATT